jgi:hypothetical protein
VTEFRTSIDIGAPAARVWEVMREVDRWHEWTPSIRRITRLGGRPLEVGMRAIVRQPRFPPALWKVSAIEPGRSFTWTSVAPGMRVVGHHQVDPAGPGARASLAIAYSGPLGALFARLTRGITERYIGLEAAGLKARSENPAFRHEGGRA